MTIIIVLLLMLIYLLMIFPNISRKDKLKPYEEVFIAHRGLFDNAEIPENSIPAFKKAVEAGLGIELDVQLSRDNQLVVFHDESLFRMTGVNKLLRQSSYEELKKYKLLNTEHAITLLSDVLKVLNKNTPLIIEIKPEGETPSPIENLDETPFITAVHEPPNPIENESSDRKTNQNPHENRPDL